ncbi:MAG: kinase/pyrophosphorylase [Methanobacteriota archaeon]|nr:MAG: kinase/pyrophosphorylase [Euryarchaeota archaeon]
MHTIFVVSDGTGRTAFQAIEAALTQFPDVEVDIKVRPGIRTETQVMEIIVEASDVNGIIVHTIVTHKLRDFLRMNARLHNVDVIDIMGPLLAQLSHHFANSPSERPGLFRELNRAYFQRIEAMEFAFRHDDGQHVHELDKAEIVLVGVSRTFKTPLSIYLAFKGWYVANVPIVLHIPPPPILFEIPPERVFALMTTPRRLSVLRSVRDSHLGGATGDYAHLDHVKAELRYAREIIDKNPNWTVIDVTNKPIEEIAFEILEKIRLRKIEKASEEDSPDEL